MPMQSGSAGGGAFSGLSLKAWALAVGGVIQAGRNIATVSNPNGASSVVSFTFTAALPNANYMVTGQAQQGNGIVPGAPTTAGSNFQKLVNGVATSIGATEAVYIAVYG